MEFGGGVKEVKYIIVERNTGGGKIVALLLKYKHTYIMANPCSVLCFNSSANLTEYVMLDSSIPFPLSAH